MTATPSFTDIFNLKAPMPASSQATYIPITEYLKYCSVQVPVPAAFERYSSLLGKVYKWTGRLKFSGRTTVTIEFELPFDMKITNDSGSSSVEILRSITPCTEELFEEYSIQKKSENGNQIIMCEPRKEGECIGYYLKPLDDSTVTSTMSFPEFSAYFYLISGKRTQFIRTAFKVGLYFLFL